MYVQRETLLIADVFESFRNKCVEIYELDPAYFLSAPGLAWQAYLKKRKIELKLLIDYDMLLTVEKRIRGGMCHAIHWYAAANNKYMKEQNKSKGSSYLIYLDANNLYGCAMSQKLLKFNEKFIKSYDKNSDIGYIIEVVVDYPKSLYKFHNDLPFLPEKMRIKKCSKLVCNIYNKNKYFAHIRTLKQALNHGLIIKKVYKVIQFNQKAWLKSYIVMNFKSRTEAKSDFEKDFFKLLNNAIFGKTMGNVRKQRDIKVI